MKNEFTAVVEPADEGMRRTALHRHLRRHGCQLVPEDAKVYAPYVAKE